MKNDIRRYISLRDALIQEKSKLETRLDEIAQALGESSSSPVAQNRQTGSNTSKSQGGRRRAGGLSLRDAVLQVTSRGALTKEEILNGVKQLGYRFSTDNPLNSLGVILYGKNPKFKNQNGRFSPSSGATTVSQPALRGNSSGSKRKRKLSPEAREKIAAAQRARWAKAKGQK